MLAWISNEWHKIAIGLLLIDHMWNRIIHLWENFRETEQFIERRHGERRHNTMTLSEILKDAELAKTLAPQVEAVWTALDNLYKAYETAKAPTPPVA